MTDNNVNERTQSAAPGEPWACKNCGQQNAAGAQDCLRCGFAFNYDPEANPSVDFDAVQQALEERQIALRQRLLLYWEVLKGALLLVVLIYALLIGIRLYANWPFQSGYATDANNLADAVLTIQGNIDNGVSLKQYDELLVALSVQETKFKLKYGESAERQRESFQKLVQSAEYYRLAREAWIKQLSSADATGQVNYSALSTDAKDEVKRYWETASSNALLALRKLD
jgi:hypothetical protein